MKRRLRELYRNNREKLDKPHDLWVLIKRKYNRKDSAEIEKSFMESLIKINSK